MSNRPADPWAVITVTPDATVRQLAAGLELRGNEPQYRKLINQWFDEFVPEICQRDEVVIAEIGCGSGSLVKQLARRLPEHLVKAGKAKIIGVDPSATLLQVAAELVDQEPDAAELKKRIEWRVGTCEQPGVSNADAVICVTVFSHLSDPKPAISGLFSALRPNGTLAIFDQDYTTLISSGPGRFNELFEKAWRGNWKWRVSAGAVGRELFALVKKDSLAASASAKAYAFSEHGKSSYLATLLERGATSAVQVGEMTEAEKEEWVKVTKEVQDRSEWFAALTYIGVLAKRSAGGKL